MLSSVRQHPALAFHSILSIALLLMISGCGGSSAFDPASFKKSASFLAKSKSYLDWEAACKAKNPVQLQNVHDEFTTSVAVWKDQEVRWTVTVSMIEETSFLFSVSNQSNVFVVGYGPSESTPDWKTKVAGLAVGKSVNITAKIKVIRPYGSYQDMIETKAKDAGIPFNDEDRLKSFAKVFGQVFSGITNLDEKRDAPFILVELVDAKIN